MKDQLKEGLRYLADTEFSAFFPKNSWNRKPWSDANFLDVVEVSKGEVTKKKTSSENENNSKLDLNPNKWRFVRKFDNQRDQFGSYKSLRRENPEADTFILDSPIVLGTSKKPNGMRNDIPLGLPQKNHGVIDYFFATNCD